MTEVGNIGVSAPSLASPRIMRVIKSSGTQEKSVFSASPEATLRALDDVIARLGPASQASGKENQSPTKPQKAPVSESELYRTGCECLETLWSFESKKTVKSSEIDRRQLLLIQKLVSGSDDEIGFGLEQIVVLFKRTLRRINVDHEVFKIDTQEAQLSKLLLVDVPPRKKVAAVVNIVVSLHLAMLKAFARRRAEGDVMDQLVASLKHPCGPLAWTGKTPDSHKEAKLTTLSKLTAALSRKCTSNKLNAMKLQLVSMECSSDMSQMDLLTDTVQKMTDANVSEEERNSLISDLLKYLGGLENDVTVASMTVVEGPTVIEAVPTVSIVEALHNSGSFSEEFSLSTLLRSVKTTDDRELASKTTLAAIEKFFRNTHKSSLTAPVTNDHIRAMTALLQAMTTGVHDLDFKKPLSVLCELASVILKNSHPSIQMEYLKECFTATGEALREINDMTRLTLVSNMAHNLGAKSTKPAEKIELFHLSVKLHRPVGMNERYLMKCSALTGALCDAKRWSELIKFCSEVVWSFQDETILSEDCQVLKYVKLLSYALMRTSDQFYTFDEESNRPLVQIKLLQIHLSNINRSSQLKAGVSDRTFKFQYDLIVQHGLWLELARILTRNLAECGRIYPVSMQVLRSLVEEKINRPPLLDFYLACLETIYLEKPKMKQIEALAGTIKPTAEDSHIISLMTKWASCQAWYSLELKLHKFSNDKLALAQCYLHLGDTQRCRATLKEYADSTSGTSEIHRELLFHQLHASSLIAEGQTGSVGKRLAKHIQLVSDHPVYSRGLSAGRDMAKEEPSDYCVRIVTQLRFWRLQSQLFFERCQLEHSVATARKAVALSQAWLKKCQDTDNKKDADKLKKMSELPSYAWEVSCLHLQSAIQATTVLLHLGMWKEAEQVIGQTIELQRHVGHWILVADATSLVGWIQLKKGAFEVCMKNLETASNLRQLDNVDDTSRALLHTRVGALFAQTGDFEGAEDHYETATRILNALNDSSGLSRDMSQLHLARRKKPAASSAASVLPGLRRLVAQVERLKVELKLARDEKALKPASLALGKFDQCLDQVVESQIALFSARKLLSSDAIFMGLEESAVSIPSASSCDIALHPNGNVQAAHGMLVSAKKSLNERVHDLLESCSQIDINQALYLMSSLDVFVSALGTTTLSTSWLDLRGVSTRRRRRVLSNIDIGEWTTAIDPPSRPQVEVNHKSLLSKLPDNWNVISIAVCPSSGDLVVCQYACNQDPFLLRLPLHRHNSRDVDEHPFLFSDGLAELKSIIAESDEMATNGATYEGGSQAWWARRHELDERLKQLLHDAEFCWFGGFLGILGETVGSNCENFARSFNRILTKHLPSRNGTGRRKKGFKPVTIDPRVLSLFLGMGKDDIAPELLEDLVYFVLDILQYHGEYNAYDELDTDQIFVEIEEAIGLHFSDDTKNKHKYTHTVLVLDPQTVQFPWENISTLCGRSVSRVSSLQTLSQLLDTVQPTGTPYYVLNPAGDLIKTQKRFEDALSPFSGVVGKPPSEKQWVEALKTSSALIYIGHGGGQKYVRNSVISKLDQCCPAILLGCSSAVLDLAGDFEPAGIPVAYMSAGCPSLVANLWDVTDKDIDLFGRQFLTRWGVFNDHFTDNGAMDCALALSQSRNDCKLRYLNGAAPVLYGIPTFYNQH